MGRRYRRVHWHGFDGAAEVVEALLWLGETLMGLVVKPGRAVGARSFVVAVCLAGLCTGYFASQVYFL